jgi:hypothetical protein
MAIKITNQSRHLLIVPLNNGESLYLAPGATSGDLDDILVNGNEKIAKLSGENLIATVVPQPQPPAAEEEGAGAEPPPAPAAPPEPAPPAEP